MHGKFNAVTRHAWRLAIDHMVSHWTSAEVTSVYAGESRLAVYSDKVENAMIPRRPSGHQRGPGLWSERMRRGTQHSTDSLGCKLPQKGHHPIFHKWVEDRKSRAIQPNQHYTSGSLSSLTLTSSYADARSVARTSQTKSTMSATRMSLMLIAAALSFWNEQILQIVVVLHLTNEIHQTDGLKPKVS